MSNIQSIKVAIFAIAAVAALAGCASAPKDSEVREALRARILSTYAAMFPGRLITDKDKRDVEDAVATVKVAGCKKADAREGFNCDWSGSELIMKIAGDSGRIFKGESGWTLVKAGG